MTFDRARRGKGKLRPSLADSSIADERRNGLYRSDIDGATRGVRALGPQGRLLAGATIGSGGDAPFVPVSIDFPSSSPPRWNLASALGADSPTVVMSWWEKPDVASSGTDYIIGDGGTNAGVRASSFESGGTITPLPRFAQNTSNTISPLVSATPALVPGEWNFVAVSVDCATNSVSLCVINSSGLSAITDVGLVGNPSTVAFTSGTEVIIGSFQSEFSASTFFGQLAEITVYAGTGLIDLSDAANRRKFVSADGPGGVPVSLGADGSTPFGVVPYLYMTGADAASWNNVGSAGAFTLTGTASAGSAVAIP